MAGSNSKEKYHVPIAEHGVFFAFLEPFFLMQLVCNRRYTIFCTGIYHILQQ